MYATVESTPALSSIIHQAKQTNNFDMQTTDCDNYDIITHVEGDDSAHVGKKNKSSSKATKSTGAGAHGKAAKTGKEKKATAAAPETMIAEVEYSVPDKSHKQKKKNARKSNTNLEPQGASSTSLEYNTLLHVMSSSSSSQRLSMPPPTSSEYSIIARPDNKRNGSTSDVRSSSYQNGRQRGRASSPPEEPPPPLPPPFVDEENPVINNAGNKALQASGSAAALKQQQCGTNNDLSGLYGNTSVNSAREELALYDDPDNLTTPEPQQEMYMNIGKR